MLIVDAANVVGSRPDGWWRDRAGAAGRLVDAVRAAVDDGRVGGPAVIVLEGAARAGAPERSSGAVRVVHAAGEGDETVVALAEAAVAEAGGPVTVVTADRALAARVLRAGAVVAGPRWLVDRLGG